MKPGADRGEDFLKKFKSFYNNPDLEHFYPLHIINSRYQKKKGQLVVKILCKLFVDPDKALAETIFEANNDLFILQVPYSLLVTIPLSFVALARNKANRARQSAEDLALLDQFNTWPVYDYKTACSDVTNQQYIDFQRYAISTYEQWNFFKRLHQHFKCAVNCFLAKTDFEDFLLQLAPSLVFPASLSLRALCSADSMNLFCSTVVFDRLTGTEQPSQQYDFVAGRMCARQEFVANPRKIISVDVTIAPHKKVVLTNEAAVHNHIQSFWQHLLETNLGAMGVESYRFRVCTFDIEMGWKDQPRHRESFPSLFNGFVQCICFSISSFVASYTPYPRYGIFVCLPAFHKHVNNIAAKNLATHWFNRIQGNFSLLESATASKLANNTSSSLVIFSSELDMISAFLNLALVHADVIVGYNSLTFDLPILTMRYQYLKKGLKSILPSVYGYTDSIELAYQYGFSRHSTKTSFFINCPLCAASSKQAAIVPVVKHGDQSSDVLLTCGQCLKSFILQKHVAELKYEASFQCNKVPKPDDMPLNVHVDIYRSSFLSRLETPNLQLDTVCKMIFKTDVLNIAQPSPEILFVAVKSERLEETAEIFLKNIRLHIFYQSPISKQIETRTGGHMGGVFYEHPSESNVTLDLSTGQIRIVEWHPADKTQSIHSSLPDDKKGLCWLKVLLDQPESVSQDLANLFVSVGKTSELSRQAQLSWSRGLKDVVETLYYCYVDVHLTTQLEFKIRGLAEIIGANFKRQVPYSLFNLTDGRAVAFKENKELIENGLFVFQTYSPQQIALYFTSALVVGGVPAIRPATQQTLDPNIVKMDAQNNAYDIMTFNNNIANIHEAKLGTMGLPLDSPQIIKAAIDQLVA